MICRKLYAHKGSILLFKLKEQPRQTTSIFSSSGLLCRGSCMIFLLGSVFYRAGAGRHGNAIKKRRFAARAQTLNAHCFVRFSSFAAFKKGLQYTARRINSSSIRPNGRDVRAMGLSQNSARKSPKFSSLSKRKRKRKLMRSGGISDEDALNRPFSFTLGVNDPIESHS